MMIRYMVFLISALVLPASIEAAAPSSYFGGIDNEAYLSWLDTKKQFTRSTFVTSTSENGAGIALHWSIDDKKIRLAVVAKATGWAAFGLGESGSMLGADIVSFSAASQQLVDSYVLDQTVTPLVDDCQSWTLVDSMIDYTGFIMFEAIRLLDTDDTQDRIFVNDTDPNMPVPRVLVAWGDSPEPSFHGLKTAKGAIRFFGTTNTNEAESFVTAMAVEAEGNFLLQAQNFSIPTDRTTYQQFCFSREDLLALNVPLDGDLHVVGYEAIIDPRTVPYVHHFVMSATMHPYKTSEPCNEFPESSYSWAPGSLPLRLPLDVGGPLGSNGYQSFSLEIHYNNPDGLADLVDSSGVRMYYTSQKRLYDLGVLTLGDPQVALSGQLVSPERGLAQHIFDCDPSCSSSFVTEPVTVLSETLHMHKTGVRMVSAQIRNGTVIRQGMIEYWDFAQQGDFAVVQPTFTIESGDSFRTICEYVARKNETWGLASDEEMCIATLYYYPRLVHPETTIGFACAMDLEYYIPECGASHSVTLLGQSSATSQPERLFGLSTSAICPTSEGTNETDTAPTIPTSSSMMKCKSACDNVWVAAVALALTMWS